jgi:hypothetical protein
LHQSCKPKKGLNSPISLKNECLDLYGPHDIISSTHNAIKPPAKSSKPGTIFAFAAALDCTDKELVVLVPTVTEAVDWTPAVFVLLRLVDCLELVAVLETEEVLGVTARDSEVEVEAGGEDGAREKVGDSDTEAAIEAGTEEGASEKVAVADSEKRESVRLYAAAQDAKSIPSGQHQVPPEASEVQKYPWSQEFPEPSGQQDCWMLGSKQCKFPSEEGHVT